jgi:hypothetical protein
MYLIRNVQDYAIVLSLANGQKFELKSGHSLCYAGNVVGADIALYVRIGSLLIDRYVVNNSYTKSDSPRHNWQIEGF